MLNRYVLMMLAATLCLSGCKMFFALEKPIARVQSVTLDEQTEHGSRVLVTVELANPNDVALPLVDAQYTLSLAPGSRVIRLRDAPNRTLPSKGRSSHCPPLFLCRAVVTFEVPRIGSPVRSTMSRPARYVCFWPRQVYLCPRASFSDREH